MATVFTVQTQQPRGMGAMVPPAPGLARENRKNQHTPPGLECLKLANQLLIQNLKVNSLDLAVRDSLSNSYMITNGSGQKMFFSVEKSNCCLRLCCESLRKTEFKILNGLGREVIHLDRPFKCDIPCYPCIWQRIEVFSPPGTLVGSIEQQCSFLKAQFRVKNAIGDTVFKIISTNLIWSSEEIEFELFSDDKTVQMGKITKLSSGTAHEGSVDAEGFGITFPMNMDITMKTLLLGALFLIDIIYFEPQKEKEST